MPVVYADRIRPGLPTDAMIAERAEARRLQGVALLACPIRGRWRNGVQPCIAAPLRATREIVQGPTDEMEIIRHEIDGVVEIRPKFHRDARGWFAETFNRESFETAGLPCDFVQDNRSLSRAKGTLRGLHFQLAPHAQAKLVGVLKGSVYDVAVDLRRSSPTFGRHVAVILSAELGNQLLIPKGFGHGYCTLEPDTEVFYKVSSLYAPAHERAVLWSDPALAIAWPIERGAAAISDRDATAVTLAASVELFE